MKLIFNKETFKNHIAETYAKRAADEEYRKQKQKDCEKLAELILKLKLTVPLRAQSEFLREVILEEQLRTIGIA